MVICPQERKDQLLGNHKQDQDSREGDFLDPICGGYLKIKGKEDVGVLRGETKLREEMEVNIWLPVAPWWCVITVWVA